MLPIVNVIYPGIFHHNDGPYWVEFPDLNGCQSFGDTIEETFSAAKEAVSAYCAALLEIGKQLPKASDIESLCIPENAFPALIETTVTPKEAEE